MVVMISPSSSPIVIIVTFAISVLVVFESTIGVNASFDYNNIRQQQLTQQLEQQQQQKDENLPLDNSQTDIGRNITKILNSFFDHGYDKRVRPNYGGPPVEVEVSMHIIDISSVSEVQMDFTTDFYFRQRWKDNRLKFEPRPGISSLSVGADVAEKIWVPDTFFANEKSAYFHIATTRNTFLRIGFGGEVFRSMRLTVTASCPMDLQYFPMDRQICLIEIESYGYSMTDIMYKWMSATAVGMESVKLPQFEVHGKPEQHNTTASLSTGNYSRLICEVRLRRSMGYYLIQIYIPASLIVVISWVSFWLHRNATPARVQLGVLTVLTMTTLMSSTNSQLPKISYVKSIDVFLGTCFVMVFAALLEYAAVGYIGKRISMRKNRYQQIQRAVVEKRQKLLQTSASSTMEQQQQHQGTFRDTGTGAGVTGGRGVVMSSSGGWRPVNSPPSILKYRSCEELHSPLSGPYQLQQPPLGRHAVQHFFPPLTHPHAFHHPPPSHVVVQSQPQGSSSSTAPPPVPPPPPPSSLSHFATIRRQHSSSSSHHQHHHSSHPHSSHHHHHNVPSAVAASDEQQHHHRHHHHHPTTLSSSAIGASSSSHHYPIMSTTATVTTTGSGTTATRQSTLHRHHSLASSHPHHPQEVRLDMGKGTALAHSISVGELDPSSSSSPTHHSQKHHQIATRGAGMESSGLRNRSSAAAHHQQQHRPSMVFSSSGGGGGGNGGEGPSSPHPVQSAATTTGGMNIQIPIPKNLNELFGVSPSDIDKYSRVVFPVCFVCFNLMYWMIYLHISKTLDPNAFDDESVVS